MEWTIPIQKLEIQKIQLGILQKSSKPMSQISYSDGQFVLQHLNILLPPLQIKEYNMQTGKLVLNLNNLPQLSNKLLAIQNYIFNTVYANQRYLFSDFVEKTKEQLYNGFQPFVDTDSLYLYCPIRQQTQQTDKTKEQYHEKKHIINIWDKTWKKLTETESGLLEKNKMIRVAFRFQGISYQLNPSSQQQQWTGKFRVQHRISCIYIYNKNNCL